MGRLGLNQGSSGNISARCGADMLVTPSAIPYEDLRPAMIVRLPLEQTGPLAPTAYKPSTEWRLHRDILRARPEIGAVVHCHAAHATALSILRLPLPPVHYMIACFCGANVRCAPYAPFGTQQFSDVAVAALVDRTAALLANHGAVALGVDVEDALRQAHELETLARMYLLARMAGEPTLLTPSETADALSRFADYRARRDRPEPT
jgi:L-fuculose-phosphate aldolase